jgi:hypothetical protein
VSFFFFFVFFFCFYSRDALTVWRDRLTSYSIAACIVYLVVFVSGQTPRPPTPRPTPPTTPLPCTDGRGGSGSCQTIASCSSGVSTTAANGANGCQSAGSGVSCCTYPSCSASGVSGTCLDTSKTCLYNRMSIANGAFGCESYPNTVDCCLSSPLPNATPRPTPTPIISTPSPPSGISQVGNPCSIKSVPGTCQFPSSCAGLASLPADGASGCLGSEVMCCTYVACLYTDPFGQKETTTGQCRHKINQSNCPTTYVKQSLGASGCNNYNVTVECCLDEIPAPRAMPFTPAPTPYIPPAPSSTCQYMGDGGTCIAEPSCIGIGVRAGEGATGCAFSSDLSVVCCMQRPCTVTDPVNGEREGLCRPTRRCQADGQASYQSSDGASGCETFGLGNNCCSEPVAPLTQPPANDGFTETSCSVQTDTGRREGTCYEPANCEAEFHPSSEAGFMGCRNAAQFANRGCCVVRQTTAVPTGACTPGDPKTCPLGEQCQMVAGAPTCIADRNFDCKAAGGCIIGGQECAPDGPNGAYVCGAARTCRVIPCQRADAMCIADTRGLARCVLRAPSSSNSATTGGSGLDSATAGLVAGVLIAAALVAVGVVVVARKFVQRRRRAHADIVVGVGATALHQQEGQFTAQFTCSTCGAASKVYPSEATLQEHMRRRHVDHAVSSVRPKSVRPMYDVVPPTSVSASLRHFESAAGSMRVPVATLPSDDPQPAPGRYNSNVSISQSPAPAYDQLCSNEV